MRGNPEVLGAYSDLRLGKDYEPRFKTSAKTISNNTGPLANSIDGETVRRETHGEESGTYYRWPNAGTRETEAITKRPFRNAAEIPALNFAYWSER